MVLSDRDIVAFMQAGEIVIDPFDEAYLEPASYDLRLGDDSLGQSGRVNVKEKGYLTIARGETVVLHPVEVLEIGLNVAARYGLPSSLARQGLIALSGPQIDPGFKGMLALTLFNAGTQPVVIAHRDRIATMEFVELRSTASRGYRGPYQDQRQFTTEDFRTSLSKYKTFEEVEGSLRRLEVETKATSAIVRTVLLGLVTGIVIVLFQQFLDDGPHRAEPTPTPSATASSRRLPR